MKANRALYRFVILPLAVLAVVLAGAIWFGRDNLFRYLIQPQTPFQVQAPPPAPDYATPGAWLARPLDRAVAAPAVFLVHPNTSWTAKSWNVAIDDPQAELVLQRKVLPNHAGPFASTGAIWAPRYRQATLFALLAGRPDTRDALDLAYGDVAAAFDHFLVARPEGAPFLLVGSGQGGQHVARLLGDAVIGTPAARGLVAAYVIDQGIGLSMLGPGGRLAGLSLCASPDQTGCLVSYVVVDQGDRRWARFARERASRMMDGVGSASEADALACVNPLTGGAGASASAGANRGSASASGLEAGVRPAILPGETGAACVDGLLEVDPARQSALRPSRRELGANHKPGAYNLFWDALASDSARRLAAFGRP